MKLLRIAAGRPAQVPAQHPVPRLADDDRWLGRAMLAPAVIYIALLVGFPFLLSIYYSLTDVTVGSQALHFVGLQNFRRVLESDTFWRSLRNALVFTLLSQLLVVVLAKMLAMALYSDFRGKWLVRLLILLPWVAPISLGTIGWCWPAWPSSPASRAATWRRARRSRCSCSRCSWPS
ncbi:hypothetical protein FQZ97_552500 [compost metagenome]